MLSKADRDEVRLIAAGEVQAYFNHYLLEVFPKQVSGMIRAHDVNVFAHGGIVRRFAQAKYLFVGFALAGGAGLGELARALL